MMMPASSRKKQRNQVSQPDGLPKSRAVYRVREPVLNSRFVSDWTKTVMPEMSGMGLSGAARVALPGRTDALAARGDAS
jgi:hypothetical protein